jgi:hypothetical protein
MYQVECKPHGTQRKIQRTLYAIGMLALWLDHDVMWCLPRL